MRERKILRRGNEENETSQFVIIKIVYVTNEREHVDR